MSMLGGQVERWSGLVPAFLVAGLAWWVCGLFIEPHLTREKEDQEAITNLHGQIETAAAAIREIRTLEIKSEALRSEIEQLENDLPGQRALLLFPEQMEKTFTRFGVSISAARLNKVGEEASLPGYSRGSWSVTLPLAESAHQIDSALLAVAELERNHPFVKVVDFAIQPDPEVPARHVAAVSLLTLFRK